MNRQIKEGDLVQHLDGTWGVIDQVTEVYLSVREYLEFLDLPVRLSNTGIVWNKSSVVARVRQVQWIDKSKT